VFRRRSDTRSNVENGAPRLLIDVACRSVEQDFERADSCIPHAAVGSSPAVESSVLSPIRGMWDIIWEWLRTRHWGPASSWFFFEVLPPLAGPPAAFIVVGFFAWISRGKPTKGGPVNAFVYDWSLAWDPMTWLYGTILLAIQLGLASGGWGSFSGVVFYLDAMLCVGLLASSMARRGSQSDWEFTISLSTLAIVAVAAAVLFGYFQKLGAPDVRQGTAEGAPAGSASGAADHSSHVP
jgi:hypothetical protein